MERNAYEHTQLNMPQCSLKNNISIDALERGTWVVKCGRKMYCANV